jgi:hypothetical protein
MSDAARLTPATPEDLAFALRYSERKRTHDVGEIMAAIVAKRLVEHLERSGSVVIAAASIRRLLEAPAKRGIPAAAVTDYVGAVR